MPTPEIPPGKPRKDLGQPFKYGFGELRWPYPRKGKKRRRDKDPDAGGVPAIPDRPLNLSGGAAAELDFEDG